MARLHRDGMPEAFLPTLGEGFLRQVYRALAQEPGGVVLVAEEGGEVVGFATGVVSARAFSRRFYRRHGLRALLAAAPRLIRPGNARRAVETARQTAGTEALPDAELLSIALAPVARRRGLGRALVDGIVAGLAELGSRELKVVVAAGNTPGNRLFLRMGFARVGEVSVHDGRPSNVWLTRCRS